jgi:hypothetical protein
MARPKEELSRKNLKEKEKRNGDGVSKSKARKHYEEIKKSLTARTAKNRIYDEAEHCEMVLQTMSGTSGTVAQFCVKAGISDTTFWRWCNDYPIFNECYRLGHMIAETIWEKEGELNKDNPEWNFDYWKLIGKKRFQYGNSAKIRVNVEGIEDPWQQYKHIMRQAAEGEFTSAELKQVIESVNIGIRAFETFELMGKIEEMKEEIRIMGYHSGQSSGRAESLKKAN